MSEDSKFSFIGTLIGAIAGSTSDFSGGRGRVNAQATQDIKNDAFERKLKQNQNASDRIIKDGKTDANKKIVELQKLSNENTNAISGQISKIDAKLNNTISRVSTIETGLGDLNRALKKLSKENGKDEFQKVTFANHEKRIKQLEKVNGISNANGSIFDLLGRMSKNKWLRLLGKGGIIGSALAAAGYLTYREFRARGQDREKDIDLIKKRLDSIQDPKSPAGRKAIADAARESKRVKQLSGMELRENKSKLIEQKKRIATKAKESGNVRFGAIQSIEAELDELQGKQMSSAQRNAAVARIIRKNPGLKEQDLGPGYARQVDRARAWEKKDLRKSKRNIRRGAYGTMDDEGEMYDDFGTKPRQTRNRNGGTRPHFDGVPGSIEQFSNHYMRKGNDPKKRLQQMHELWKLGGNESLSFKEFTRKMSKADSTNRVFDDVKRSFIDQGGFDTNLSITDTNLPGTDLSYRNKNVSRLNEVDTYKLYEKGGWEAIRDHNIRKNIWKAAGIGRNTAASARKKWPGMSHLGSSDKNGRRQQLTGMTAQQHQDYQEKKQFLKFGALPGGFEHVDGNRGILGKPMAVMAGGAQARGSGGGGGGFGGGPGGSGTPGGAFTSTQAPSDFVSGRKDAVDVKAYANFGDGSVNVKSNGVVDKQQYYNAAVKRFANSTLNGFVPADGHLYGITTGSPEEWAKLAMQTTQVESSFKTTTTNMADPGGSRGLMQWGNRYGINDKTWKDPNAQLNAFVGAGKKWIVDGGGYINPPKGVKAKRYKGWGGFSAMFSTFRNNKVNSGAAKNVANQLSAGAPKRVDLSPKTPDALADAVKLKKKPPVPLPVQKPNGLQNTIMDRSKEDDGSGRDYGVIQTDLLEELRKKRKSKGQYPWTASDDIDGTDRAKERAEQATFMEHGRMNLSSGSEMTPAQVKEAQKWNRENPGLAQTDPSSFGAWKKATNQGSSVAPSKSISGNSAESLLMEEDRLYQSAMGNGPMLDDAMTTGKTTKAPLEADKLPGARDRSYGDKIRFEAKADTLTKTVKADSSEAQAFTTKEKARMHPSVNKILNDRRLDPRLKNAVVAGARDAFGDPNDPATRYEIRISNAYRSGGGRSKHGKGKATDLQIWDRKNNKFVSAPGSNSSDIMQNAYGNPHTVPIYRTLALSINKTQYEAAIKSGKSKKEAAAVANQFTHGLNFYAKQGKVGGAAKFNGPGIDQMHYSIGEHGRQGSVLGGPSKKTQAWMAKHGVKSLGAVNDITKWNSGYKERMKEIQVAKPQYEAQWALDQERFKERAEAYQKSETTKTDFQNVKASQRIQGIGREPIQTGSTTMVDPGMDELDAGAPAKAPADPAKAAILGMEDQGTAASIKKEKIVDKEEAEAKAKAAKTPGSTNNGNGGGSPERSFPKAGDSGVGGSSKCWV